MIRNAIGENAGLVWTVLDEYGTTSFSELLKLTELSKPELYMAIGWLAREGKIFQTKSFSDDWKLMLID